MTKRILLVLTFVLATSFYFAPTQEAKAIDPVTIAILAPFALQAAKTLAPYIKAAMSRMFKVLFRAGTHLIQMVRLPWGFIEVTILSPWRFKKGFKDLLKGGLAPFKFCGNMLLVPLAIFGIGV